LRRPVGSHFNVNCAEYFGTTSRISRLPKGNCPMALTAADALVATLIDWGVEVVFGMPGDGINGIMEALRKRQDRIGFIQVRHEESAAFMACGYAKWTGRLGVCLATSGPGGIHLLNGLYDAKLDSQPVLAITGLQHHDLVNTYGQQDVELDKLFMDACVYSARVMAPAHVENVVELACRTALANRGVSHVTMPVDTQSMPLSEGHRSERNLADHVSNVMASGGQLPDASQLRLAAEILNQGEKVFILAGQGALGARAELEETAELLGAPIGKALLGKAAIPDDSAFSTGGVGLLGTRPSQEMLESCDTLLIVGSTFPYIEFYPSRGKARAVQVDIDAKRIGLRFPVEAGLVGDSSKVLRALLPHLKRNDNRAFLEQAQHAMLEWKDLMGQRGTRREKPMKPQVVTYHLDQLLAESAIVATDSGTVTTWAARYITMRGERMFSCSGMLASMACAVPYAIAAALAYPERQVVAIIGDGSLAMLMGELATLRKYNLGIKVVVIKNNTLGQIKWEQMVFLGNPEYGCELQPIDFVKVAEACGIRGIAIDDPERCGAQLKDALATPGPCLIEAVVDPHEPPWPPKVDAKQAVHLAESLAKGTANRSKIALTLASDVVRELV
jgi:pyruvate dehydrogenase (quinone)/pyruvate oxidase